MHTEKRNVMSVSTLTLLAVLVVVANECHPSNARVSVPRRSVKQPIQLDLDLKEGNSEETADVLAEAFSEVIRVRRQDWIGSGGLDFSFAEVNVSNSTIAADNHTSALLYWSGKVVFILFRGFNNDSGTSTGNRLWSLFRSMDYGAHFSNVTSLFPDSAVLDNIWPSPNSSIILFSGGLNQTIYQISNDGAVNYTKLQFSPDTLLFQSCELDDAEKYGTYILGYDKKQKSLWVTQDIYHWTQLGTNVTSFFWRELNSSIEHPSTVYFDQKLNYTASLLYVANESTYNEPRLLSPKLGAIMPNTFSLSHQYMFVQKKPDNLLVQKSDRSSLWVSFFREPFLQAKFPVDDTGKHFSVVDASEGRVMLVMYSPNLNSSTLFQSDKLGTSYTLSLENIVVASPGVIGDPAFDVYKVQGLPATYLANRKLGHGDFNYTYITFNSGGRWSTVDPPVVDSQKDLVECHAPCSLHLHLLANANEEFSQVLSLESAPGFLMALGTIGTHLDRNASVTQLYVSHDGGAHWEESAVGSGYGFFQVLDYGVYTLFVKQQLGIGPLMASCDQGRSWATATHLPLLRVSGLSVDPKATASMNAIVYGYRTGSGKTSFEVFALSFEDNGILPCEQDDYHLWTQSSEIGLQSCVLGQRYTYKRRNLETCCYIEDNPDYTVNYTLCVCDENDYECDVGFYRKDQFSTCDSMPGVEYPPLPPSHCPEGGNYSYSTGYRKIAGDRCIGGNNSIDEPIVKPCPIVEPDGLHILIPSQNMSTFPINTSINFTLIQTKGSQLSTVYVWRFGDNTTFNATGLGNANSTSHMYSHPGTYTIFVIASNDAGQSQASQEITVLDIVKSISVDGPSFVAVGTQVGFCVSVKTQLHTKQYTPAYYQWMVDDQQVPNQNSPCYSRRFFNQTVVNISVSVINALGVYSDSLLVEVTKVPAIAIVATSKNRTFSLDDHIPAKTTINFSIRPYMYNNSQTFPSDMEFFWRFFNETDDLVIAQKSNSTLSIDVQLPAGGYIVTVTGNSSIGTASSSISIYVQETIAKILVDNLHPGYRQFTNISTAVSVLTRDGNLTSYSGDVQLELWEQRNLTHHVLYSLYRSVGRNYSSLSVNFPMTVSGVYSLRFVCFNDIPSFDYKDQDVFIAGADQYQHLRLVFNIDDLAENDTNIQWIAFLKENITGQLMKNLGVQRWQLEVTFEEEDIDINGTYLFSEDILVSHVYVLPANLTNESISDLQTVTNQFLEDANNGDIAFYANDSEVVLSSAESGVNSTCQFCPVRNTQPCHSLSVRASSSAEMTTSTPTSTTKLTTSTPTATTKLTTSTPTATSESADSRKAGVLVGLVVGLTCLVCNLIQLAVITGMCCKRWRKRLPRRSKGYLQMGEFERPVQGTFAVKNESLDEQDIEDDNEDDKEEDQEDDIDDDNDSKNNEEAAFITKKPSSDDDSNV